jgi:hypothetical protein
MAYLALGHGAVARTLLAVADRVCDNLNVALENARAFARRRHAGRKSRGEKAVTISVDNGRDAIATHADAGRTLRRGGRNCARGNPERQQEYISKVKTGGTRAETKTNSDMVPTKTGEENQ